MNNYKSVTELCGEYPNLNEYIHKLEQQLKDISSKTTTPLDNHTSINTWCQCCNDISPAIIHAPRVVSGYKQFRGKDITCKSCGFVVATLYEETHMNSQKLST